MTLGDDRKRRPLTTLILLLLAWAAPPLQGQSPALVVPAKFDAEGFGQFLIPVTVRDKVFWCSLDSGGSWVFRLDTAKALAAGLTPNSTGSNAGVGPDVQRDERVQGVTAELGSLVLPNLTIVLSPLPEIVPDMDCVFGLGILQDHVAQFDYAKPELRLFEAASFQPPARATALPFELDRFRNPYLAMPVQFSSGDSAAASLILDTGASYYGVVLTKRFVDEQDVRRRTGRIVSQATHTPGLALSATRLPVLRVGSFEMRGPIAALIDTPSAGAIHAGLIGAGFFKHFTVAFDYRRRQMWLEQTSPFPAQQAFDASGVEFTHAPNGRYRVHDVIAGSAAADAGMKKDDILVSLDGRDARELTISAIKEALRTSGATRRFVLMRRDAPVTITVLLKELL
jgi:hypothetical protein